MLLHIPFGPFPTKYRKEKTRLSFVSLNLQKNFSTGLGKRSNRIDVRIADRFFYSRETKTVLFSLRSIKAVYRCNCEEKVREISTLFRDIGHCRGKWRRQSLRRRRLKLSGRSSRPIGRYPEEKSRNEGEQRTDFVQ